MLKLTVNLKRGMNNWQAGRTRLSDGQSNVLRQALPLFESIVIGLHSTTPVGESEAAELLDGAVILSPESKT